MALFALQSRGITIVIWQGLIWGGWMMQMTEGNGLAYDGRGFTMEVLAGVRGWDDPSVPHAGVRVHQRDIYGGARSGLLRVDRRLAHG